jgi:hypothetical protein
MSEPRLSVLGVYRPLITAEVWQQQLQVTGNEEATREHFERLVLIEAVVEGLSEPFDMSKFGQVQAASSVYPEHMQVGYDEGLLSQDGELLIQRKMKCVQGIGPLRFAVYLHMYAPERPLRWKYGVVNCPLMRDAPVRLLMLMPYRACT